MCCPKTGLSLCDRLHSGRFDREVILCAFDLLELDGDDMRFLPLEQRTLLAPIRDGIVLSERIEGRKPRMRPRAWMGCRSRTSKWD